MRKNLKKLSLNRETLRSLHGTNLGNVAGGSEDQPLDTHYDHTCGTVCDIETWHCTRCSIC